MQEEQMPEGGHSTRGEQNDRKNRLVVSPVTTVIIAALAGLLGTLFAGILNLQVEKRKQEGALILEGIRTGDTKAAARNLLFLSEAGLIHLSRDQVTNLRSAIKDTSTLPVLPPTNVAPERVSFTPSSALTPDLKAKLQDVITKFQNYSNNLGFRMEGGEIDVTVVPGFETGGGATYKGQIAYYDDQKPKKAVVVASEFANDENIVLRQYAHHLLTRRNMLFVDPNTYPREYGAIESGLATYFPCSFGDHPMLGDTITEAAKRIFKSQDLESVRSFNEIDLEDWKSVQLDGSEVWGGAFWQIRKTLGKDMADKILLTAWTNLKPSRDDPYANFTNTLLEADRNIAGGQHVNEIKEILRGRGLTL
jgi:hypothetical protein